MSLASSQEEQQRVSETLSVSRVELSHAASCEGAG